MPKKLSVADIIEKNKLYSSTPFVILVDLQVIDPTTGTTVTTLYLARNNEDVVYGGNTYLKANFEFQYEATAGEFPSVSISVNDMTNAIQAIMQNYGGGVGSTLTIYVVNTDQLDQPADNIEYFDVLGARAANYVVQWTLGGENILSRQFPKRKQFKNRCNWRYKGTECGYAGVLDSCDLSLDGANGCSVHNNSANYGGFPGINASNVRY